MEHLDVILRVKADLLANALKRSRPRRPTDPAGKGRTPANVNRRQ
jgi:hypothetical protein